MYRYCLVLISFLTLTLTLTTNAHAWGKFGHLTVCDLAYRNLTDASKKALNEIFQTSTGGITILAKDGIPKRHYTSFNMGCLEEDELPRKRPSDHFLNVSRQTSSITKTTGCSNNSGCILTGIEKDLIVISNAQKSNQEKAFALLALGHWIGDIHQPLHISFTDDKGGNNIGVKLEGKCGTSKFKPKNLHAVWDNCLPESGIFEKVRQSPKYKKNWSKSTITYRAVDEILISTNLVEEESIVKGDIYTWADESFQIAINPDTEYCIKVANSCQSLPHDSTAASTNKANPILSIDQAYLEKHKVTVEERLKFGGFRLAHLINKALDPDYKSPVQNSTQPST